MPWHSALTTFTDTVSVPTAAQLNEYLDNLEWLHAPPTDHYEEPQGSDLTTAATTWANISANFSKTIVTTGGLLLVIFSAVISQLEIDITVDGTRLGLTPATTGTGLVRETLGHRFITIPLLLVLSAASHTIAVQWKATSGTGTLYVSYQPRFDVREL